MGYVSEIEQFVNKVRERDFEDCLDLNFNGNKENAAARKRDLALWNKYIAIPPEDFLNIIQSRFYVGLDVDVELTKSGLMTVTLKGPDDLFLESFFSADLENKKFSEKSTIRLFPKHEGKGLANSWLLAQVELYAAIGAHEVRHEATLMGGARKWARLGMHIDFNTTDPEKLKRMSRNLKAKLEAFKKIGAIDENRYQALIPFTDLKKPDDLVQLVKHDFVIGTPLISESGVQISRDFMGMLSEYRENNPLESDEDTPQQYAERQGGDLMKVWNRSAPKQRPVKFSQFGLVHERYNAIVHLDNSEQMEDIGWNVGGWKFGRVMKDGP